MINLRQDRQILYLQLFEDALNFRSFKKSKVKLEEGIKIKCLQINGIILKNIIENENFINNKK